MKNATKFADELKHLHKRLQRDAKPPAREPIEPLDALVRGAMSYDVSDSRAEEAMKAISREFVDLNELRVATDLEVQELLGVKYPAIEERVAMITLSLNFIFENEHTLSLDRLRTVSKRDARVFLRQLPAINPFVEGYVMLMALDGHAMPLDAEVLDYLREQEVIEEESKLEDAQKFVEYHLKAEEMYDFYSAVRRAAHDGGRKKEPVMTERLPANTLRLGLPSGSLQQSTFDLFGRAGYRISVAERSVFPRIDDENMSAVLFRAQEISRYVADDIIDCGLTGHDWIVENGNEADVIEICELTYSRASANPIRWVLAVPEESPIRRPEEFDGKIIATELVNTARKYFAGKNIKVNVEFSWGTTEIKARLVDGIVDCTETGSSLRANSLRIVDTILTSTTRFIASKKSWAIPAKRTKMENIAMLLKGAIEAKSKIGLKMNAPRAALDEIVKYLPSEKSPTISPLADPQWIAVEVILEEKQERELIPRLKRAGATGIITYPLNKVIP